MYTINIKGHANLKDPAMVKLEMIFFKSNYPRVTKVVMTPSNTPMWCRLCGECHSTISTVAIPFDKSDKELIQYRGLDISICEVQFHQLTTLKKGLEIATVLVFMKE